MSSVCQVSFYVLSEAQNSAQNVACRLALKAWEQGHSVMVLAADEAEATELDALMWEFPAGRFLPHSSGSVDDGSPVRIGVSDTNIPDGRDLIINLALDPVSEPARFNRVLEIVPSAEKQRLVAREKFRRYRDLGLEPVTHHI